MIGVDRIQHSGAILIWLITAGALVLRLYRLDQFGFWLDEGISAQLADIRHVHIWTRDVQPPLYYALLLAWKTGSGSDSWLRLLSVALGGATVPVVFSLGKRMFSERAGLWAAAFFSVTHVHVNYSQQARMYPLMVLLFAAALWGAVVGGRDGRVVGWIVYSVSASMLSYTHGVALIFVAVLAAVSAILIAQRPEGRPWRAWALSNCVTLLLFTPFVVIYLRRVRDWVSNPAILPGRPEPPVFTMLFDSTVSPIPPLSMILRAQLGLPASDILGRWVWFAPILLMLVVALTRAPARKAGCGLWPLVAAYLLPLYALSVVSVVITPVLALRVLLPTVVPIALLLGAAADSRVAHVRWRDAGLVMVLVVLLLGTYFDFRYRVREDWRPASQFLQQHVGPRDILLFNVGPSTEPAAERATTDTASWVHIGRFLINRYDPRGILTPLPQLTVSEIAAHAGESPTNALERTMRAYSAGEVVWLIESYVPKGDKAAEWLDRHLAPQDVLVLTGLVIRRAVLVR